ncbi:dTMP kinase [Botrimarina hoheduenensis]|uniref:Thymidylate kinase n=1 Tax=Botrimarina hoheduenensis TaxID=2528000 RepID=A0A5C5WA30_9BACT|nr:dTMP kinase [Botrimarina hoheduenensis]TWT47510.1 Thymidylate kinase [Botrimarina hoheduenensis]
MFFSFDGIDGVGKTTQIERFVGWLRATGREVVTCRDPGSTPLGEKLRGVLLHSGPELLIGPTAEMLLYMAARSQLVEECIRPALERGATVVSDRFLLANLVYQSHAGGLDRDAVGAVGTVATHGLLPDTVFVLDLDPAMATARRQGPDDRMEARGDSYRERVRQGFIAEARRDSRIVMIDAAGSVDEVEALVRDAAVSRHAELAAS